MMRMKWIVVTIPLMRMELGTKEKMKMMLGTIWKVNSLVGILRSKAA